MQSYQSSSLELKMYNWRRFWAAKSEEPTMWPPHKGFNQSPFLQAHQSLRRSAKVEGVVWCQPWNTHVPPKEDLRKRPPLKTTPHARRYKMATDLPHNTNPDQPHRDTIDYASHRTNIVGKDPAFHCSNFTLDSEPVWDPAWTPQAAHHPKPTRTGTTTLLHWRTTYNKRKKPSTLSLHPMSGDIVGNLSTIPLEKWKQHHEISVLLILMNHFLIEEHVPHSKQFESNSTSHCSSSFLDSEFVSNHFGLQRTGPSTQKHRNCEDWHTSHSRQRLPEQAQRKSKI